MLYLCVAAGAAACAAAGGLSRVVPVRPCAAADSLLGPRARDPEHALNGHVYELTQPGGGIRTGRFNAYTRPNRVRVRVNPRAGASEILLDLELSGPTARAAQRFGGPLGGSLIVDDSLTFRLALGVAGPYEGPAYLTMVIASFGLPAPALLALARSSAAALLLTVDGPPMRIPLVDEDRTDIAALYVVLACGALSGPSRPSN